MNCNVQQLGWLEWQYLSSYMRASNIKLWEVWAGRSEGKAIWLGQLQTTPPRITERGQDNTDFPFYLIFPGAHNLMLQKI